MANYRHDLFTDVSLPETKAFEPQQIQIPSEYTETNKYFQDLTADDFSYRNIYGETVSEFKEDPEVIEKFELLTDYLGNNRTFMSALVDPSTSARDTDPAEFLRDDVIRIGAKLNKAMAMENAPEDVKEAYRYLQDRFDRAEIGGIGDFFSAFADYGTDVVFNPETLASVVAGIFSGGQSAAGTAVAQQGARLSLAKALGKASAIMNPTTVGGAATYAGAFTGLDNYTQQQLDISLDKREEVDEGELFIATALGAGAGAGVAKLLKLGSSRINRQNTEQAFEDAGFADDFAERARRSFDAANEKADVAPNPEQKL